MTASVAVCLAATGAMSVAAAMDFGHPGLPPADIPGSTGSTQPQLRWGGPVPRAPVPGEVPVYVPSRSAYPSVPQPQPQYAPPAETYPEPQAVYAPDAIDREAPDMDPVAIDGEDGGDGATRLYEPIDALAPAGPDARIDGGGEGALPPLDAPVEIDGGGGGEGVSGYAAVPREDPWAGLTQVTPGAVPPPARAVPAPPILEGRVGKARPSYASLEDRAKPARKSDETRRSIFDRGRGDWGRGALEKETPTGYRTLPASEAMCRRQLQKLGVKFVDASSISSSRSCGIDHPVKIHDIAPGIAMRPSATLNCQAALRVAQWMKDEVKPAARWKMLKRPTVLINASSYRCSRIAGSRSVSEHASGSALDVRGFKFSDGSIMEIEKKGFFSFREKGFQKKVRESACRYFGTVLGPGYNEDHADHLHLDTKQRRRAVCK